MTMLSDLEKAYIKMDELYIEQAALHDEAERLYHRLGEVRELIIDLIQCCTCEGDKRETYQINITSDFDTETWNELMNLLQINLDYGDDENAGCDN